VSACNADAKTVETAIAAYQADGNPTASLVGSTGQGLLTGTSATVTGSPFLQSWPSNAGHYTISLNATTAGEVDVTPKSGTAQAFNTQAASPATGCYAVS
jgi:hypothetical protein